MLRLAIQAVALAAAIPSVLGSLYITAPVASTVCTGGQSCNVAWNDDGTSPYLSQIGACTVGLYVGNAQQQTLLQPLGAVDVSSEASATFIPQAVIGPNDNIYFLRFDSVNLKSTANPQYPWQGFSAKFTLQGMTGTFNATIQSQINAATQSSGMVTSAVPQSSSTSAAATTTAAGSTSQRASSASSASSPTSTTSGAAPVLAGNTVALTVSALAAAAAVALAL